MTVKEMARKYYPVLWNNERIEALVAAGKLSREDANEIMGMEVELVNDPILKLENRMRW